MPNIETAEPVTPALTAAGMVLIPAGPFRMGSSEGGEFERPAHDVYLDSFLMDETPVTNSEFRRFIAETGYRTTAEEAGQAWGFSNGAFGSIPGLNWRAYASPDRDIHPVVLVSWEDAAAYCAWADKSLPTEAQWEKAALGGLGSVRYPWGEDEPDGSQCNFARTPGQVPPTTKVNSFPPNPFGLYDLVGNVWQWCRDRYSECYYGASPGMNPPGPDLGATRVRRGGSWNVIQAFRLRCANRGAAPPLACTPNMGFRCVRQ